MSELARLRDEHVTLGRLFTQLGRIIERPMAPSRLELFELRRQLVSTLIAHLKLEDWALYPRLIHSGDSAAAAAGQIFKDEMGGLAPAFLAYSEKWNANTIDADWPAYCQETRAILDSLTNRLSRENRELLPQLERLDQAA